MEMQDYQRVNKRALYRVCDSHSDEDVDGGLMGSGTMWTCTWLSTFRRYVSSQFTSQNIIIDNVYLYLRAFLGKAVPQHTYGGAGGDRMYSSYSFTTSALDVIVAP
jgi:hypothetical protein